MTLRARQAVQRVRLGAIRRRDFAKDRAGNRHAADVGAEIQHDAARRRSVGHQDAAVRRSLLVDPVLGDSRLADLERKPPRQTVERHRVCERTKRGWLALQGGSVRLRYTAKIIVSCLGRGAVDACGQRRPPMENVSRYTATTGVSRRARVRSSLSFRSIAVLRSSSDRAWAVTSAARCFHRSIATCASCNRCLRTTRRPRTTSSRRAAPRLPGLSSADSRMAVARTSCTRSNDAGMVRRASARVQSYIAAHWRLTVEAPATYDA